MRGARAWFVFCALLFVVVGASIMNLSIIHVHVLYMYMYVSSYQGVYLRGGLTLADPLDLELP